MVRFALFCAALAAAGAGRAAGEDSIRDSVVRITAMQRAPNFRQPWTKSAPAEVTGTGFVIEGKQILTNAHVVAYASQIYVQPNRSADRIPAKVVVSAPAIDLALLSLDDAAFFDTHPAVPMSDKLPAVKSTVNVYGFPLGGEQISVTEGIISRVEFSAYFLGTHGLRVQIDAALNPGNSGGPAVSEGRLVGVAFSGIPSAENIGFLIPSEEVRMFLADVQDGTYRGPPRMQESLQSVQNDSLRAKLGLKAGVGGVLIQRPYRTDADYPLKFDDVITHIGDHPLDAAGNVQVEAELQLPFFYYVPPLAQGGSVRLTVLRGGESIAVDAPVKYEDKLLIPSLHGGYPRYFIYGPMVFSPPSKEALRHAGREGPAIAARGSKPTRAARIRRAGLRGRRAGHARGAAPARTRLPRDTSRWEWRCWPRSTASR